MCRMQTAPPLPQQQLAAARGRTKSCREGGSRAARPPPRRASSLFPDAVSQSRDMQSQSLPPAAGGVSLPWHASARPSRETRPNASRVPRLALPHAWSFWYTPHTHPRARKHACRYAPRLAACCGARVARIGLLRVVARIGMRAYARVVCAPQRTHAPPQGWKQARPAQGGPHPRSHRVVISVSCHEGSRLA